MNETAPDLAGKIIRGYELKAQIGAGGFGAVYSAYQPAIKREVAVKVILPDYANKAEFIREFESEAQLVARLEHPNIVPLYDFWREPGGAYLVMRWLRGGSLRGALTASSFSPQSVARLLEQIASGLAVAHRKGIVHRDIKPDNILLDEDRNAYLADFGIAKITSERDANSDHLMVGSPAYIAPEQVLGQVVSPQTDLYSLGIVIYELLMGKRPFQEETATELLIKHINAAVPSVQEHFSPAIDNVIQRATAKAPEQRYPDAISMATAFRRAITEDDGTADDASVPSPIPDATPSRRSGHKRTTIKSPDNATARIDATPNRDAETMRIHEPINPYKGLRAFQEADANDFFGRELEVHKLIERLKEDVPNRRFLALVGASGSGKSSLARAGLIPALRRGALPGSDKWFFASFIPGAAPFDELAQALLEVAVDVPSNFAARLAEIDDALQTLLPTLLPDEPDAQLFLMIDQFEEVFTACPDENIRMQFLREIQTTLNAPGSRLWVAITLRADFYDRPLQYPEFGDLLRQRTEVILPLNNEAMAAAISAPALRAGLTLEAGVLETILKDVSAQPGALPLMQYSLTELFERRQGLQLTLKAYEESGGVLGALARRADQLYETLDTPSQDLARAMFLRLVTLGEGTEDTRRRVVRAELSALANDDRLDHLLSLYGGYRLLSFDRDPITRAPTIELAHEALIRAWGRLRDWLASSRDEVRTQRRLSASVEEWENAGHDPSFLASGARLDQFSEWLRTSHLGITHRERTYLESSIAEQAAKRAQDERIARRVQNFGRAAAVLGVMVVLALAATAFAAAQAGQARSEVEIAAQTLTPVPRTLTPVQLTLVAGNALIRSGQATATSVAVARQQQEALIESLRLGNAASNLLGESSSSPELAALLAIRALRTAYTVPADAALVMAFDRMYAREVMSSHTDTVTAVALAPDGTRFSSGQDGALYRWRDQAATLLFSGDSPVRALALSPEASPELVIIADDDGVIRLLNARDGKVIREITQAHKSPILCLAFAPDGSLFASGGVEGEIHLWDKTGTRVKSWAAHDGGTLALAFAPNSSALLSGGVDGYSRLWSIPESSLRTEMAWIDPVLGVAYPQPGSDQGDGQWAVISAGSEATLINPENGETRLTFRGHTDLVNAASFNQDGSQVVTVSADGTLRVWNIQENNPNLDQPILLGHTDSVLAVSVNGTDQILTGSADQTVRLWEIRSNGSDMRLRSASLAAPADPGISVVRLMEGTTSLLVGTHNGYWIGDFETGRIVSNEDKVKHRIQVTAHSGKWLMMGTSTLFQFDLTQKKILKYFELPDHAADAVLMSTALSPDDRLLLTGWNDRAVRLWDIEKGGLFRVWEQRQDWVGAVAFTPDGKAIIVTDLSGGISLITLETGQERPLGKLDRPIWSVTISPDGQIAVTGDENGQLTFWSLPSGRIERVIKAHSLQIGALAFSADGRYLLSGSADRSGVITESATGREYRRLIAHEAEISAVAFSPDGKLAITGSADGEVRLWDVDYQTFGDRVCKRLNAVQRRLSAAEQGRYGIGDRNICPED